MGAGPRPEHETRIVDVTMIDVYTNTTDEVTQRYKNTRETRNAVHEVEISRKRWRSNADAREN